MVEEGSQSFRAQDHEPDVCKWCYQGRCPGGIRFTQDVVSKWRIAKEEILEKISGVSSFLLRKEHGG